MINWKFRNKVPVALKEKILVGTPQDDMLTKADEDIEDWQNDIKLVQRFKDPIRCPTSFLFELGALFESGLVNSDTERQKRQKIANAVPTHKKRGLFNDDVKIRIDNITGFSSAIFDNKEDIEDWILLGDFDDPDNEWGALGGDNTDPLGLILTGAGDEGWLDGVTLIDLGNDSLSQEIIDKIVEELKTDLIPAYFLIILGFVDANDIFIAYSGGVI